MTMSDDVTKALFARAIAQAGTGLDEGGIPIGAVLVERHRRRRGPQPASPAWRPDSARRDGLSQTGREAAELSQY